MAWFWFFAFCCIWIYAVAKKNDAEHFEAEIEKFKRHNSDNEERWNEAEAAKRSAKMAEKKSREVENRCLKLAEATNEENILLKEATASITNLWVNDSFQNICDRMTSENYSTQKNRLEKVFETCNRMGISFDPNQTKVFFGHLKRCSDEEVKKQKAKDEQARIRELLREEQRAEKAKQGELKRIEQEKKALEEKMQENADRLIHLHELEHLKQLTEMQRAELEQAKANGADLLKQLLEQERRKSMAELTKAGHVYVISNPGSFGETVFKVGMTRRLIPEERIKELGDASVPFPFDVHMMIATENAPELESKLHEHLWNFRLNLVNDHKEFFKVDISKIKTLVDQLGGDLVYEYKDTAAATQWRESEARRKSGSVGEYSSSVEHSDEEDVA